MKIKAFVISLCLLIAAACLTYYAIERNGTWMTATSERLSIAELQAVLSANGIKLGREDTARKYFRLNKTDARTFDLENGERISFYLFRSDKARVKGEKDFEKERTKYKC